MENLRKVEFIIEKNPGYGLFDLNEQERKVVEENEKPRIGYFHCWTPEKLENIESTDLNHYQIKALIEDEFDGKVYKIEPENIQFLK